MRDEVRLAVFEIIAREAAVDPASIVADATLKELGITSLDAFQIHFEIEDRFKVPLPDPGRKANRMRVGDLVERLEHALDRLPGIPDASETD